jgi:hypothetical protein
VINRLARETGFIKRSRKLSAYGFINTLMFSFSNQKNTSLPDITADLNQQFSIDISKEGLHKRFSKESVNFLKELVKHKLSNQFSVGSNVQLNQHFLAINIKDSSKFSLPDIYYKDYPGFGNFSKTRGLMHLQYEYDLVSGNWKTLELTTIKRNDQQDSKQTIDSIKGKELYIRDLGYVTPIYLKAIIEREASFLNRIPPQVNIYTSDKKLITWKMINRKFSKTGSATLDMDVLIYERDLIECRLVMERVPDIEYRKRLRNTEHSAKKHGVGLSEEHKIRCRYNTFITNVSRAILPIEKIRKTYYLRWQIELVFKTWKSTFEIHKIKKMKTERMECQLLAKLLWVLLNWRLFQTCNHYLHKQSNEKGISVLKFFKRCLSFSNTLRMVVLQQLRVSKWLAEIFIPLIDNTVCEAPVGKQTHYQTLHSLCC